MKARNLLIFLLTFSLLFSSTISAEDSCPSGMRKTYVDDENMNAYGSARSWLAAACFFQFPGSLFFQRKVLIEPRFEVHLKATVDPIDIVENSGEQKIYGYTIVISGYRNIISGLEQRSVEEGTSADMKFTDIGYNNFVNALIIEFDFEEDNYDPAKNSFSIRYCGTACSSYDSKAFASYELTTQKYIPGEKNEWDFRLIYDNKKLYLYSGPNSVIYSVAIDLENTLGTNIAFVGFTGFMESNRGEINLMGTFICEDNYVITKMQGYFFKDNNFYSTVNYEPAETINYAFQFINSRGELVPHTFGYYIWDYSFFVTQDCDSKGSYTINKYDNYTLILTIPACPVVGKHSIRINEEKKGAGILTYYNTIPGPLKKIKLVGYDGNIGTVPIKSDTDTFYLNFGDSNSGDFVIKENLKIVIDLLITDAYDNKVTPSSPNTLFTLKKVANDGSTSYVSTNVINYAMVQKGDYYQMTISVSEIGTYQIEQNEYLEKPIKLGVIPGEANYNKSYCTLDSYYSNNNAKVGEVLYYNCYLRDDDGNEIQINTFLQNSKYDFICSVEKTIPSYNYYNPSIINEGSFYKCRFQANELGNFNFNGFLRLKTTKEPYKITPKLNQFYVRGDVTKYTIKRILNPINNEWLSIETSANTLITHVSKVDGFLTCVDFAEANGEVLISEYVTYPFGFNISDLQVRLSSTHDESFSIKIIPKYYSWGGRTYIGLYTAIGEATLDLIKKSSFNYYIKLNYYSVEKSASIKYVLNIGSYVTCFHDLSEKNTKVNIGDQIDLIIGGDEKKLGTILLSTTDNNLYNYDIETKNVKMVLNPPSDSIQFRVVALSIEGIYDVYAKSTQSYVGELQITIKETIVKIIKIGSAPSEACNLVWSDPSYFIHKSTNGKEIYYEYNGPFDNGNILVNFILKDKYNNTIEKEDYFTKFWSDIYSEQYGTDLKYYSISYSTKNKRYEFRDNLPYQNSQRGWVFYMRDSTCNNKYYVRYDGKKGGSPLNESNSYFNLLNTEININYDAYVDVIYKDNNNQLLGLQEGKLDDAKAKTVVIAINSDNHQETLEYVTTTSNYALRYKAKFTVSGTYTISAKYNNNDLKYENTNQLKVINNIYDLTTSKFRMIIDSIVDMSRDVRVTINNFVSEPIFRLEFYTIENVKTNYDKGINFILSLKNDNITEDQTIIFTVDKKNDDYVLFTLPDDEIDHFHNLRGDFKLILQDEENNLTYPVFLTGDGSTDYSNDKNYDLTKTKVKPNLINGMAGKTYSFTVEMRANDGLRWNYLVNLSQFEVSYSQKELKEDEINIKTEHGPKKGQVIVYISQRKIYEEGVYNILTFTYEKGAISSNALFGVKCGDLHHFKLTDRSTYGNVINPPKIYFEPYDMYENLYTDLFKSTVTQEYLNSLTLGTSKDKIPLISNNTVAEQRYLVVQYISTISTDVVVSSDYLTQSFEYRIYSGPIDKDKSYAEITSSTNVAGGEYYLLITPKDYYNNDIDGLNETHLEKFKTIYKTIGLNDDIEVENCYLIGRTNNNPLRALKLEGDGNSNSDNTNIECKATIKKAGNLQFVVKYSEDIINCKNDCQFMVSPSSLLFSNTEVLYTNKGVNLTTQGPNVIEIGTIPIFELFFYDKFKNQLDESVVDKLRIDVTLDYTDVKLCVTNKGKTKTATVCPTTNGDDNENKFKYLTNGGNYKLNVQNIDYPDDLKTYPISITGGYPDGSSEPADYSKTLIEPSELNLKAGEEGVVKLELRTAKRQRKNYWYPDPNEKIKIEFANYKDTCRSNVEKGELPGQYLVKVSCTKTFNSNEFSITIETHIQETKVGLTVNSSAAFSLEVDNLSLYSVSSDKYTWKTNPTNDDLITFGFKLKDKYNNYIINNVNDTNEFSISSETYGSDKYYSMEFDEKKYLYTIKDEIPFVITKHTWNIIIAESNRKYSFIYNKNPGVPDFSKSYWTIDKTSYILKETSTISVYLLDRLGVNLGTLEGKLNTEKDKIRVITNKEQDYSYNFNSLTSTEIKYTYTYEQIGDYQVSVTYNGKEIGDKKKIKVAYQKADLKNCKLYYNIDNKDDVLMLTTTQTNMNNIENYPFYKFFLYTAEGTKITLYDKSLEATCVMTNPTYPNEEWEMIVKKLDDHLEITYTPGFEEKFSKLPLGLYYIKITYDNEFLRYPLYLLGEMDVSPSSDYDLGKIYIKPTEIEAIAGEEKEVEIEFRASDGLRWNYEVQLISFGVSNSYNLDGTKLQIQKLRGEKDGQMKLLIKQTVSTTNKEDNILTLSYQSKTIPQKISLNIRSAALKSLVYNSGLQDGTVINPPTLTFYPFDEYENICTQIFDPIEYPKDKLEALTKGISINEFSVIPNIYAEKGYLFVSYGCNKATTIKITSQYFTDTYSYNLKSGPIDSSTTYAEVTKYEGVIAGEISIINIYPKDKYGNDVTIFSESDISNFEVYYGVNEDTIITVSKYCTKIEGEIPYIKCESNITTSGDIKYGVDYKDQVVECKHCEFNISPDILDFTKTKVVNQNTNKEMSQIAINVLTITNNPRFILSFYDRFMNAIINKEEIQSLDVKTKIEVTDVKLCVNNSDLNKLSYLCESTSGDENEEKWKYIPNGNSYQYIAYTQTQNLVYPVEITGGYSDGDSGPIDITKTYINPSSLTLTAGVEGTISLELRTKDNIRKNYWYKNVENNLRVKFDNNVKDCRNDIQKGNKPGQYNFIFICTQKNDLILSTIVIENTDVPQKVSLKVIPNEPAWSELYTMNNEKITENNLGSVSVESKFQMINKLYDAFNNSITNIDFDLSILKLKISPTVTIKNHEYSVETLAQTTGEIIITLKSTYAGELTLVGALLPLTSYYITFTPGQPSAENSLLEVNKKEATVGEIVKVYITPHDKYNNLILIEGKETKSPYQLKYTNEGDSTKFDLENYSIETVESINVFSYPGQFYVRGIVNFFGYLNDQPIKCISCKVDIKSGDVSFESSLVMRYESTTSDFIILKNGTTEKNYVEEPVYRLYPRDEFLNTIDYIPEEKFKSYKAYLESQSENVTYHLKLNNKEYKNQEYAEFVIDDDSSSSKYSTLVNGTYYLIFIDGDKVKVYDIILLGDGKGGSSEDPDFQMTHINEQNLKFMAGESGYLILEIRTAKNIRRNDGNYTIQVNSTITDTTFDASVSKAGILGVFQVTISTKRANTYPELTSWPLNIYVNNVLVEKLHPEMEVSPNIVVETVILENYYIPNSKTQLLDGNADNNYIFEVASYDQYENLAETKQEIIGLAVTYIGGTEIKTTSENVIKTGYRKYTVPATKAGNYVVSTSKSGPQGIYLKNEAYFKINPGVIDLTKTVIKEKTSPIQAGDKPVISIVAYDKWENLLNYADYMNIFTAIFIDSKNQKFNSTANYDEGVKKVFYTSDTEITVVGITKVDVFYGDKKEKLDTSKVMIQVLPDEPYPPYSILSHQTSSGVLTEYLDGDNFTIDLTETLVLNVTLYDKYKNYVNNLPVNAEVQNPKLTGNKMKPIEFNILKNTGNFDLDFNGNPQHIHTYKHLVKGTYDLTLTVLSSLGKHDFHYYLVTKEGDDLHGNGDYVVSKCVINPSETTLVAGNSEKFTLELRTEEGLLYNNDIDLDKNISIGKNNDDTLKYTIEKAGSIYGIYTITIYSEKKGEYTLNVALTDPSSISGEKKELNPIKYKVTPHPLPDKAYTEITGKSDNPVEVDSQIRIAFLLFDKFKNKMVSTDNIVSLSYFTLFNNDEPYSYTLLNFDESGELYLNPKYPPKIMRLNLLYNNGVNSVYIFNKTINFTIHSTIDYMKTQIISSNKEKIYAGQQLDMWLYTLDQNYKCLDNDDLSSDFEIEVIGPLDSNKQYSRTFGVKKTKITEGESMECNNEYQIDNESQKDATYRYAGNYLIKVKYLRNNLIAQFNQVCYPLSYSITGFYLQYDFNPDAISILDTPSFTITGSDAYGNKVTDPLLEDITISFTNNNEEIEYETLRKLEMQKGTVYNEISIHLVGSHQLHIFYKGQEVEKINDFKDPLPIFTILTGPCYAEDNDNFDLTPLEDAEVSVKAHFTFQCYDIFENKITKGGEQFTVKGDYLSPVSQGDIVPFDNAKVVDNGDGSYNVEFIPSMKGIYLFNILVGKEKYGQEVKFELKAFQCTGNETVICPNQRKCVDDILKCIEPPSDCNISTPFNCTVGGNYKCVKSQIECDCPLGFVRCKIMNYCVPANRTDMCPVFKNQESICRMKGMKYNFDGICRNEEIGPSQRVCPIGKVLCADLSCRDKYEDCIETEERIKQKQRCIGQQLKSDANDCPSSITCIDPNDVVCPTGECVSNEIYCPSLSKCNENYPYLCQNDVCALQFKDCPSSISCGENRILCPDNICRESC